MKGINMIDNNFDLNLIKVFMCVYEQQSINKASQNLYLSQPAVSYSIKKLENILNCKLFNRLSKGCKPTPLADNFYDSCKNGLFKIEQGILSCNKDPLKSATLNIGASPSVIKLFLPKIKEFNGKFPNIKITFTEVITKRLQKYLERGDIDIAIVEDTKLTNKNVKIVEVCPIEYCFVASKESGLLCLSKDDLKNLHIGILKKGTSIREFFDDLCFVNNINASPFYEMASPTSILEFVKQNLCIGFLPKQYVEENVKIIDCDFDIKKSSIVVIKRQEEDLYFVDEFINCIKK